MQTILSLVLLAIAMSVAGLIPNMVFAKVDKMKADIKRAEANTERERMLTEQHLQKLKAAEASTSK